MGTEHYSETRLDRCLEERAQSLGILSFHVPDSRGMARGWPDRVYLGTRGILFRELKSPDGEITSDQRNVGYRLQALGMNWAVWRPADLASGRCMAELEAIALCPGSFSRPRTGRTSSAQAVTPSSSAGG